jgi:2-methylisocitrate lyase-like PEP mutase family enzyme
MITPADKLRELLQQPGMIVMPCCFDALSARLIEQAGFALTFMSGFGVSAARIGLPDTGLISYGEMVDQGRNICAAVSIPVIGDADTGYGNALNVRRTVQGFARAGFAALMIEDQLSPKRCGHTRGKSVVDRDEACMRVQAAVDTRDQGEDILILARTDARATHGLDEALARARMFAELGADILFVEAPRSEREMQTICGGLPGPLMVNMLEGGQTPLLSPDQLKRMGFKIAAFPLTLLSASMQAMKKSLISLREHGRPAADLMPFDELKKLVGFDEYYDAESRYTNKPRFDIKK